MPFYISSCLFTNNVLCACAGSHMCCASVRVRDTRTLDSNFIFWSFVRMNLIIWRHNKYIYFNDGDYFFNDTLMSSVFCMFIRLVLFRSAYTHHTTHTICLRQFKFVVWQVQYHSILLVFREMPKIKTATA